MTVPVFSYTYGCDNKANTFYKRLQDLDPLKHKTGKKLMYRWTSSSGKDKHAIIGT